jgi:hypothetical protein
MSWHQVNAALGGVVIALGLWLMWGELPVMLIAAIAVLAAAVLAWAGTSIAALWGWATAVLGLESLAWPMVTMVRIRLASAEPTEEEMGLILTAVLFGLFSSIFWLTFSYGIFKKLRERPGESRKRA